MHEIKLQAVATLSFCVDNVGNAVECDQMW